jgi:hypothetical protein
MGFNSDICCPSLNHAYTRQISGVKTIRVWNLTLYIMWYSHLKYAILVKLLFPCLGKRSRYSDWPRAGRLRGRSSSPDRVKNFHFSMSFRPAVGPYQPPIQWVPGAVSSGVKRQGREADHSPSASAEVRKMWIYTSTPHTPSWRSA